MRPSELVLKMMRKGFTLIEVMVSVLIISLVIAGLLEMRGNGTHKLLSLKKQISTNEFNSFLIGNKKYGFESTSGSSDKLLSEFRLESDLRKELKKINIKVKYKIIDSIDMGSGMIFEIGKTTLNVDESSSSLTRLKLQ